MTTTFCTECGKPLVYGVNECGYCKTPITQEQKDRLNEKHPDVIWTNVSKWVIALCVLFLISCLPWSLPIPLPVVIGAVCGYYWSGPECVKAALKCGRSPNWAFFAGGYFTLIGWVVYWCYLKLRKDI